MREAASKAAEVLSSSLILDLQLHVEDDHELERLQEDRLLPSIEELDVDLSDLRVD